MTHRNVSGIVRDCRLLPEAIGRHLESMNASAFVAAAHSRYRVNSDIPFAWLILTTGEIFVCSTHRRGVHHRFDLARVNSVLADETTQVLRILPQDPGEADLSLPFPALPRSAFLELAQTIRKTLQSVNTI